MLVHICCAVESHYFLQKLRESYPDERLIGFFYDPNIHPYSEYQLRLLEVKRSCKMLNIDLIEGDYDTDSWLKAVRGLENEPEKGARCSVCFDHRFEVSAQKAHMIGEQSYTSTLLTSPKKSLEQLRHAGESLASKYGLTFLSPDYRKASGTQEQNRIAKEDALYRQDYCGCIYGLTMQRDQQNKLTDELFTSISRQVQPESIEARINMYEKRWKYEEQNIPYKIIKQRFLNWRLLQALLKVQRENIPAHFLPYSTLKNDYSRGKIAYEVDQVHYMNRDEVRFVTLSRYNELCHTDYASVQALIFSPPSFADELKVRHFLESDFFSLSAILIVDEIPTKKIEILCQSKVYSDVKEVLIKQQYKQ